MGTEMQSQIHLPRHYSMRDLNDIAVNGMFGLYYEDKTLKNGQYYDSSLTWPTRELNEKDKVKQMILKHESVFRQQLHELHRLYKRQRDLMNEIKSREHRKHPMLTQVSQSSRFLSHIPSEDAKKTWNASNFPLADSAFPRLSASSSNSFQERGFLKDCEYPESNCNLFQRVDLEIPADMYMNAEETPLRKRVCGVEGDESWSHKGNHEVPHGRDANWSLGSAFKFDCNGDALRSNLNLKRAQDLADLNEAIQVEETSVSASLDNLENIACLEKEIRKRDVSANEKEIRKRDISANENLHLHFMPKEFSKSSLLGRDGGSCLTNLHSESGRNGKEKLAYHFEAGQTRCDKHSSLGCVCCDPHSPFKSYHVEPRKAHRPLTSILSDQNKAERQRKRMIFGVEISEGTHDQSVITSHMPRLTPLSDVVNSESPLASHWRKTTGTLGQNVTSISINPCNGTFGTSSQSSNSFMQNLEFVKMRVHGNNSRSIPSSRGDVSYQNSTGLGSQADTKKLQGCCSSIGFDFPNDTNANTLLPKQFVQPDLAKGLKTDAETPYRFRNEVAPEQNLVFADVQMKHEKTKGGLAWLLAKPHCSVEQTKGREVSYHMNLDSLRNSSQHFFNKAETEKDPSWILNQDSTSTTSAHDVECRKVYVGDCTGTKKILGFPMFTVPEVSEHLTPASSPSKSTCLGSDVDCDNSRKDLAHNPKSESQLERKDIVLEKGVDNYISGLRHQIDLNLSANEEEAPSAPALPGDIVKIATNDINLEAPAVLESVMDISPEADCLENNLSSEKSDDPQEEIVRVAAEAIISISLRAHTPTDDPTCHPLEGSPSDCLQWFAEIISSHEGDHKSNAREILLGTNGPYDESNPDGMDYFQFMTLQLIETKEEEYCYKPAILENQKDEETGATSLPKRPRRGQSRRGRQPKDFQRDILPGLVSLSRLEVSEDLRTFEEMFKASGCTWQSSLSRRNAAKKGRGRRRSGDATHSLALTAVCLQPPIYREVGLEEIGLTGWGKRTRRLPRQRCPTGNPTIALKC